MKNLKKFAFACAICWLMSSIFCNPVEEVPPGDESPPVVESGVVQIVDDPETSTTQVLNEDDNDTISTQDDDDFSKTITNTSPIWWDTAGRPYLKPEGGIFMTPKANVYIPIATWTHMIEINLPCLSESLNEDVPISWTNTLNTITDILNTLSLDEKIVNPRQSHEHLVYLLENQDNLLNMLNNIKDQIERIDNVDQYIYGFLKKTCVLYDFKALKDSPLTPVNPLDPYDEFYRWEEKEEQVNHMTKEEVQILVNKLFSDFHHNLTMTSRSAHEAWAGMSKSSKTTTTTTTTTTTSTTAVSPSSSTTVVPTTSTVIPGGAHIPDVYQEQLRRKRDITDPTYYANHVVNQYINRGNFTNINHLRETTRVEGSVSSSRMQNTESTRTSSFQSQMFEIEKGKIASKTIPVIENYGGQSDSYPTKLPTTMPISTTELPYLAKTPKEKYAVNIHAMLNKIGKPAPDMDLNTILPSIESYYAPTLKDIDLLSAREPLEVELDQIGVMTLKLCYHYYNSQQELLTFCTDRFLPNVKRWHPICDGAAASDTLALQDSVMISDSPHIREDPQTLASKLGRYRFLDIDRYPSMLSPKPAKIRNKRGLGDFLMKYGWKPMFGAVSEYDMKKMTQFMADMQRSTSTIHKNTKTMMSMIKTSGDRLDSVTSSIRNISTVLQDVISTTQTDLSKLHKDVSDLLKRGEATAVLSALGSMQVYIQSSLTMLKFKLNDISSKYATLYDMIKQQYVSPTILSMTTLGDLMRDLEIYNSTEWMIAPTWSSLATIDARSASVLARDRTLLFTLKIPLVLKTKSYSAYMSQSIPIILGSKIVEVVGAEHYYIMDFTNNHWSKLTKDEYLLCSQSPGSICPISFPTVPFDSPDCFVSIINSKDLSLPNKMCKMRLLENNKNFEYPESGFISKPIGNNQWVVSVLNKTGVIMYELCDAPETGHAVQTATSVLRHVNVMSVTPECRIQLGDMTFRSFDNWRTSSHMEYLFADRLLINTAGLTKVKIWKMASVISETLENATIFSFEYDERAKKTDYIFKKGLASLDDILRSTNLPALNYSHIGLEEPNIPSIPNFDFEEPESWHVSQWQIWSMFLGSIPTLVLIALIIYCVFKSMVKSRMAASTVAFSALPTSFTKADTTVTVAKNISNIMSNLASGRSLLSNTTSVVTHLDKSIVTQEGCHNMTSMMYMAGMIVLMVMMILMGIHHCYVLYHNNHLIRKLMRANRAYPWNKSITMYNVEEPLVMIFLVEVYRIGVKLPTTTTLAIQVATLPSPYTQWILKSNAYVSITVSEAVLTRRSKRLIIELNWTHMCILSTLHPNIDTCQEMPQSCVITKSGLESGIDGGLPWNWIKIKQKNVLKVEVGRVGACRTLYDYTNNRDVGFDDIMLASAPLLNK